MDIIKRRITVKQLAELTPEQKEKLRESWEPQTWDICAIFDAGKYIWHRSIDGVFLDQFRQGKIEATVLPLLSIGQMIEIIKEKDKCITITHLITFIDNENVFGWEVHLRHLNILVSRIELADALWKIVKAIL